jgi:hypothetical protein
MTRRRAPQRDGSGACFFCSTLAGDEHSLRRWRVVGDRRDGRSERIGTYPLCCDHEATIRRGRLIRRREFAYGGLGLESWGDRSSDGGGRCMAVIEHIDTAETPLESRRSDVGYRPLAENKPNLMRMTGVSCGLSSDHRVHSRETYGYHAFLSS